MVAFIFLDSNFTTIIMIINSNSRNFKIFHIFMKHNVFLKNIYSIFIAFMYVPIFLDSYRILLISSR